MKQIYFALILLLTMGVVSCRKSENDVDIKTFDQQQIEAYIKANNLTNMKRDLTDGDTTGIYYEILAQGYGAGNELNYETPVSLVYSFKSLDGSFTSTDTIYNHSYSYLGLLTNNGGSAMPKGLITALHNLAKFKGTRAKFLIPSRLAYGRSGSGTGPGRLPGNQSLECYVNVINNQAAYDDQSITKYMAANNLTGYTKTASGLYYKLVQPGTGTVFPSASATVTTQYTGSLLNGTNFDTASNDQETTNVGVSFTLNNLAAIGFGEGMQKGTAGSRLSLFLPSKLGYGVSVQRDESQNVRIPANSVLHFEIILLTVTN